MRRLARTLSANVRLIDRSEAGATLVFVAVILVALLALAAFAVDFGRMYEERRQLQNGADAAALAIAEDCARGLCDGSYDEYAVAETYVDENARDGAANAWLVDLDLTAQTVTVHNRTEDPGGDHKYDMVFAGIVGFDGFTVGAEATVAWGGLASPPATIPIIISECEWQHPYWEGGAGGKIPAPAPTEAAGWHLFDEPKPLASTPVLPWTSPFPDWWDSYPSGIPSPYPDEWTSPPPPFIDMDGDGSPDTAPVPVVLQFHLGSTTPTCGAGPSGADLPGGFGWLDVDQSASEPCVVDTYGTYDPETGDYGWAGSDPGSSPSQGCDADDMKDLLLGDDGQGNMVFIPFYDQFTGTGSNAEFHISGYGAFWVVGDNFGSGRYREFAPPLTRDPCRPGGLRPLNWTSGNGDRCLAGYFLDVAYPGPGDIGPGGRGITVIKFTD